MISNPPHQTSDRVDPPCIRDPGIGSHLPLVDVPVVRLKTNRGDNHQRTLCSREPDFRERYRSHSIFPGELLDLGLLEYKDRELFGSEDNDLGKRLSDPARHREWL